jgi:hypothetical protein
VGVVGVTRPSGFGALSWLWWPVQFIVWALAAVVLAAEWVASGAAETREGPWKPPLGPGSYPRSPHCHTPLKRAENRLADDFAADAKRTLG